MKLLNAFSTLYYNNNHITRHSFDEWCETIWKLTQNYNGDIKLENKFPSFLTIHIKLLLIWKVSWH